MDGNYHQPYSLYRKRNFAFHKICSLFLILVCIRTTAESNPCSSQPCLHSGTCQASSFYTGGYKCNCAPRYYGVNCQYDYCQCEIHGSCVSDSSSSLGYHCNCDIGYTGTTFCNPLGRCSSHPCQNGGTCTDLPAIHDYICQCNSKNYGLNCESWFLNLPAMLGGIFGGVVGCFFIYVVIVILVQRSRGVPARNIYNQAVVTSSLATNTATGPGVNNLAYSNVVAGPPAYSSLVLPPTYSTFPPSSHKAANCQ